MEHRRLLNIDILRILASFMVVMLHVSAGQWSAVPVNSGEWRAMNFYDSAVRSAIPLFFMISGYMFLKKDRISIKRLFKVNVLKLLLTYILWSLLYAADTVGMQRLFSAGGVKELIKAAIDSHYHLWFLPAMIGLYCLLPVLHPMAKNRRLLLYASVLFLAVGVIVPTLKLIPYQSPYIPTILGKFNYELAGYSGYALLGYYLSETELSKIRIRYPVILFIGTVAAAAKIGEVYSVNRGEATQLLYGYMSLPVFIEALLLFIIFLRLRDRTEAVSPKTENAVKCISGSTMTVFLLHPFILGHLRQYTGLSTLSFNPWLSVPLISLGIFICCMLAGLLLERIPFVNKWLV